MHARLYTLYSTDLRQQLKQLSIGSPPLQRSIVEALRPRAAQASSSNCNAPQAQLLDLTCNRVEELCRR